LICIQIVGEQGNFISAGIRLTTRSWASHAEFVDVDARVTLGARSQGGVKLRSQSEDYYSRVEQFTCANIEKMYEFALTQVGKPYDYSAIFGIALHRDWHDESKWFCSELVAVAAERAGNPLLSTRPSIQPYNITPRDLLLSRNVYWMGDGN
jgi:uncharacterized protein YycO